MKSLFLNILGAVFIRSAFDCMGLQLSWWQEFGATLCLMLAIFVLRIANKAPNI